MSSVEIPSNSRNYSFKTFNKAFLEQFSVHSKIECKVQRFPIYPCLPPLKFPTIDILHQDAQVGTNPYTGYNC